MRAEKGFTLMEFAILVVLAGIVSFFIAGTLAITTGNFWFAEDSALRELQTAQPKVERILKSERNIFGDSELTVLEDGKQVVYLLDSDVFWNYTFRSKPAVVASEKKKNKFWF